MAKNDGGIDCFYIFVNSILITNFNDFSFPLSDCNIDLYIITSKHHSTFKQDVLNNELATVQELFDLGLSNEELTGQYREELLNKRNDFLSLYRKYASKLVGMNIKYFYVSRGDTSLIESNILSRAKQIENTTTSNFSMCNTSYNFLGSTELLSLYRQKKYFRLKLRYEEMISTKNEGYILLVRLGNYFNFIKGESGELSRYLFDSNVRAHMGNNKVNKDIYNSLSEKKEIDFWWLNNGITILSSSVVNLGKDLEIDNVQIINGLQTSETLFQYFNNTHMYDDDRLIMVKVISETSSEFRDEMIKSTNNQTAIAMSSLHATDILQRNIEDIMLKNGLYYERRTNYYKNQGIPPKQIFTILSLSSGYLSIVSKRVTSAIILKQKFLDIPYQHDAVFKQSDSLLLWVKIAQILLEVDEVLSNNVFSHGSNSRKPIKHIVSLFSLAKYFNKFTYSKKELLDLDVKNLISDINISLKFIVGVLDFPIEKKEWRKQYIIKKLAYNFASEYNIKDVDTIFINKFPDFSITTEVPEDILNKVLQLLNSKKIDEPTNIGRFSSELGLPINITRDAVRILANRGEYKYVTNQSQDNKSN